MMTTSNTHHDTRTQGQRFPVVGGLRDGFWRILEQIFGSRSLTRVKLHRWRAIRALRTSGVVLQPMGGSGGRAQLRRDAVGRKIKSRKNNGHLRARPLSRVAAAFPRPRHANISCSTCTCGCAWLGALRAAVPRSGAAILVSGAKNTWRI